MEHDEVTVSELGDQLFLNSGTLTPLLKRMEATGMVSRTRSREDERITLVQLTDKAKNLQAKIADMQYEVKCAVGLEATDFARLRDELKALNRRLRTT